MEVLTGKVVPCSYLVLFVVLFFSLHEFSTTVEENIGSEGGGNQVRFTHPRVNRKEV